MANRKYTPEFYEFCKNNIKGTRSRELYKMAREHFPDMEFSYSSFMSYLSRKKLSNGMPKKIKGEGSMFPQEIKEYIKENVKGKTCEELAEKVNARFGTDYSPEQMKSYKERNHLRSGIDGKFKKGNKPYNKGMKGFCAAGSEKGWFQKGNIPPNHRPVGSERVDYKDGYIFIKVAEPNVWKLRGRVVWEKEKGPIPKGSCLAHLDGNPQNDNIENLRVITRAENARLNKIKYRFKNPELTDTGINIVKLMEMIKEKS